MGDPRRRTWSNRRSWALSAALLLPLSSAAVAGVSSDAAAIPNPASAARHSTHARSGGWWTTNVSKVSPLAYTLAHGSRPVVEGSVAQRIRQVSAMTRYDVPQAALDAYRSAAASLAGSDPGCHLPWTVLAGIGTVESDNGQYGGAIVLANGDTTPHILGPILSGGPGMAAIRDTDGGRLDGNPVWDRAVGPMQFLPGTWAAYGADGNGDGIRDPNNVYDAALAAARYLCVGGGDFGVPAQARAAIMRYNHSTAYVDLVLRLAAAYASGAGHVVPDGAGADVRPARQEPKHAPGGSGANSRSDDNGGSHTGNRGNRGSGGGGKGGQGGNGGSGGQGGKGGSGGQGGNGGGGQGGEPTPVNHSPILTSPPHQRPDKPVVISPKQPTKGHATPPVQPAPVQVTGELTATDTGWSVGTTALDFGVDTDLSARQADYNGDGRVRAVQRELKSLEGQTFTVTLVPEEAAKTKPGKRGSASDQADLLACVDPNAPRDSLAANSAAQPVTSSASQGGAASTPQTAYTIVVGPDGVVVSINGVCYAPATS